jgi:putative transposase
MNKYNPNIHHRRSIRLKGYDYSQAGLYFITICCGDRICRFGEIENGMMILNELGEIAYNEWRKLSERFKNMELDAFQIMPNHIHGIIALNVPPVGAGFTPAPIPNTMQPHSGNGQPQGIAPTVSDIVGAYKSLVANGCLEIYKSKNKIMGKLWQRNYYEHIIRNEKSYQTISEYILNNPSKWNDDKFYSL